MIKKILIIILFFVFYSNSFANECKYREKFDKCTKAIQDFTWKKDLNTITVWWSLKNFQEFPCIQDWSEARYFQIAMDENFKSIDKDMDDYLKNLYENKNFYFWKEKKYDYYDALEHIFSQKDDFRKKYYSACVKSLDETASCVENKNSDYNWSVSVLWALDFISWSWWAGSCFLLWDVKSSIFLDIAYNWLLLNKQQVSRDNLKLETQSQRGNYARLTEAIRINQSYVERLNSKWTSKTKHTLNSR